ncbi:DUF983 domain-containing protein [Sphingorhabdus buctiana]|jgi:uncharacterized protein (DUF983 family)|uniref:DUF983 domain-containing protein n=1 Tax=Sphingorhabdus buctiana TaxID=1508805 RepID=A0ABW4MC65_9SPHN
MSETQTTKGQPGLVEAALFGLCPECGSKTMFSGPARFAENCSHCGFSYASFNVGDGPAAFLTMGLGAIVIVLAVLLEIYGHPPFWVHALIWIPLTILLVVLSLRVSKGMLLIAEHRNRAVEGRLANKVDES